MTLPTPHGQQGDFKQVVATCFEVRVWKEFHRVQIAGSNEPVVVVDEPNLVEAIKGKLPVGHRTVAVTFFYDAASRNGFFSSQPTLLRAMDWGKLNQICKKIPAPFIW